MIKLRSFFFFFFTLVRSQWSSLRRWWSAVVTCCLADTSTPAATRWGSQPCRIASQRMDSIPWVCQCSFHLTTGRMDECGSPQRSQVRAEQPKTFCSRVLQWVDTSLCPQEEQQWYILLEDEMLRWKLSENLDFSWDFITLLLLFEWNNVWMTLRFPFLLQNQWDFFFSFIYFFACHALFLCDVLEWYPWDPQKHKEHRFNAKTLSQSHATQTRS